MKHVMSNEKEILEKIITSVLGGPGGDPLDYCYIAAACAYKIMKAKGYEVKDEIDLLVSLRGYNNYNLNFLNSVDDVIL